MKVNELIAELQKVPGDADLLVRLVSNDELDLDTTADDCIVTMQEESYDKGDNMCALDIVIQNKHYFNFVEVTNGTETN